MTITRQSPFSPDITFGYASGEGSNINRFFILKAANDLRESKFVSGNFTSWTAPTIPAGSWKRLSWYGFTAGFFMTRGDGSSFIAVKDSVNPYHEVPWTAYPTSIAIKGRVASVDNPTADSGAPSALADSSPVVDIGCTKVIGGNVLNTNWIDSQSLPESGNWNAMMQDFGDPSNFSNPGVIVGNGARVIFSKSASWTPEDCPDGDWREVNTNNDGSDVFMAVGSNAKANQFMYTFDATTPGGWTVMAAPAGWNPTDPRIIFVNFGGTQPRSQGLFIAISGTDGQVVFSELYTTAGPFTYHLTPWAPLTGIPVIVGIKWTGIMWNWSSGPSIIIIVGTMADGTVRMIVSADSDPNTWTERTFSEAPA